jgi:hypothetical protein
MKSTRRIIVLAVLLVGLLFGLAGCQWIESLFNPLLGTWKGTIAGSGWSQQQTLTFSSDETWTATGTMSMGTSSATFTGSGTFTQDTKAKTVHMTGTVTMTPGGSQAIDSTMTYNIEGNTMTVTESASGGSGTYTRQ